MKILDTCFLKLHYKNILEKLILKHVVETGKNPKQTPNWKKKEPKQPQPINYMAKLLMFKCKCTGPDLQILVHFSSLYSYTESC